MYPKDHIMITSLRDGPFKFNILRCEKNRKWWIEHCEKIAAKALVKVFNEYADKHGLTPSETPLTRSLERP